MIKNNFNDLKKMNIAIFLAFIVFFGIAPSVLAVESSAKNANTSKKIPALTDRVCTQVITSAISSSGECRSFSTPCEVPEEWVVVSSCMPVTDVVTDGIDGDLLQLRKDKEDFKNNKLEEARENAGILKEKVASKKKVIQARLEKIKQDKEDKRKAVLINLINIQIKQLEKTKERLPKMPNIGADSKKELDKVIEIAIDDLESELIIVQKLSGADDMKAFAKELNILFKTKRDSVKSIVDAILASKADKTIIAAEGRFAEIVAKVAELKAAGQDTAILDNLLAIAKAKIAAADTKIGKKDLKGAINDLKEVYKNMKSAAEKTNSAE